ncbi:unnamed protein product [Adineta steineri]|uniref:G-protein coupled receptors family 1 profile domain-containing protein n=1 Tax=Adineta steineri TaxID=433720 RepID=A0A813X3A3_9BILA|nr:unnamed protein product [Adineta steineri]CAF0862591.1 unnamed protein product [Adineta steineri]
MTTLINIGLMIYFALVAFIGTLGNGIILLAYGNRWNSSKSTSVIFILILSCVDLWTCLVVVPTIAIMEYREFEVPTPLCRFYSFSKILIIISSLIMSFIALDRFLNIAVPHYRLLNPRRVKFLLITFISIGVGLGLLTALAFSSSPYRVVYLANYTLIPSNQSFMIKNDAQKISITNEQKNVPSFKLTDLMHEQLSIPVTINITDINLTYVSTHDVCFADTSIISETIRDILRHISNKFFFISIGIVTILYAITFILALHRQNPRIRALKKSLNVLNKFDSYPSNNHHHHQQINSHPVKQRTDSLASSYSPLVASRKIKQSLIDSKCLSANDNQQFEMASFNSSNEEHDVLTEPKTDFHRSISEGQSDDLQVSTEKFSNMKQVSFQVAHSEDPLINNDKQHLSSRSNSSDIDLDRNNDTYYKFPCPCSTTRQLLIKFHFAQPTLDINQWLCYCCMKKSKSSNDKQITEIHPLEDEAATILPPHLPSNQYHQRTSISNSEILKRQLHRHRIKQIRMASTFLLITVSFVLFYLPSILNAERYIKSPLWIYYLYLCTHALNPIIYCFMNVNLRVYIISMLKCQTKQRRHMSVGGASIFER